MLAVTERRELSSIVNGFMATKALFAALGVDLSTDLAARADRSLPSRPMRVFPGGYPRLRRRPEMVDRAQSGIGRARLGADGTPCYPNC